MYFVCRVGICWENLWYPLPRSSGPVHLSTSLNHQADQISSSKDLSWPWDIILNVMLVFLKPSWTGWNQTSMGKTKVCILEWSTVGRIVTLQEDSYRKIPSNIPVSLQETLQKGNQGVDFGAVCILVNIGRMGKLSEVDEVLGVAHPPESLPLSGKFIMDSWSGLLDKLPNLWMWVLVFELKRSGKNCHNLSANSLPLQKGSLPYLCFLIPLPGQIWMLTLLVQRDSTHVSRSGCFHSREYRKPEILMGTMVNFLSGIA